MPEGRIPETQEALNALLERVGKLASAGDRIAAAQQALESRLVPARDCAAKLADLSSAESGRLAPMVNESRDAYERQADLLWNAAGDLHDNRCLTIGLAHARLLAMRQAILDHDNRQSVYESAHATVGSGNDEWEQIGGWLARAAERWRPKGLASPPNITLDDILGILPDPDPDPSIQASQDIDADDESESGGLGDLGV